MKKAHLRKVGWKDNRLPTALTSIHQQDSPHLKQYASSIFFPPDSSKIFTTHCIICAPYVMKIRPAFHPKLLTREDISRNVSEEGDFLEVDREVSGPFLEHI